MALIGAASHLRKKAEVQPKGKKK